MALSPEQVEQLAPVQYEWDMLVEATERLLQAVDGGDRITQNLILEAFVVHFRQLGHFFYKPPIKDDIHVTSFIGATAPDAWEKSGRPYRWSSFLKRADRQVAHLTAERHFKPGEQQKQAWPFVLLAVQMDEELQEFCRRTGFNGFRKFSAPVVTAHLPIVGGSATATNAPITCNSVAVNQAIPATTQSTASTQ